MSISFCSRQSWYERLFPIQICITDTQHYFVSRKLCFSRLAVSNRTESDLIFTLNGKELNLVFNWKLSLDPRINLPSSSHTKSVKRDLSRKEAEVIRFPAHMHKKWTAFCASFYFTSAKIVVKNMWKPNRERASFAISKLVFVLPRWARILMEEGCEHATCIYS